MGTSSLPRGALPSLMPENSCRLNREQTGKPEDRDAGGQMKREGIVGLISQDVLLSHMFPGFLFLNALLVFLTDRALQSLAHGRQAGREGLSSCS